ncbi:metal ABC transporter permease [Rhizobiales bacterium]|uniref:metal ABC transporter permease n=1 Tax=Hongsoonwoonella zoysiae TaxID=2821844 RepID=UPI001561A8F9|nr:iron chelate uptake ABC transporter family permease subunit [Hongsoonwoonella zoysiae]NRG19670.1 metal ABC transporter permease [Hongsoonwoonella zoysiae]
MTFLESFLNALMLSAGYNTAVVAIGSALLGAGSGAVGAFVLLRKRSLVSDAMSHATLPGVVLGFLTGVWLFGDGRSLPLLLAGAALTAGIGMICVDWIKANTRLTEDTAIGTVLSTFFALGMVLLTVLQSLAISGQAGLSGFLLGSTSGMLSSEAMTIAAAAGIVALIVLALFKEFALLCFDEDFAGSTGLGVRRLDIALLTLLLAVVVIGLKTVGLVLVIALTIIPPVAARFWTERVSRFVPISAAIGATGSYVGACLSASAPDLPTGALIVLILFALFAVSMLVSPVRGLMSSLLRHRRFQKIVHLRQGLLAVAHDEPILEPITRKLLIKQRYLTGDLRPTEAGWSAARRIDRDQALWNLWREEYPDEAHALADWSLKPIDEVLSPDMVADLETRLAPHDAANAAGGAA